MSHPFDTSFTRLVGVDIPIVQAPVGGASTPELVAAVSNAGGLGMLSITWRSLDETRAVIRQTRAMTQRPFGVNLVLEWDPAERLEIAVEERVPVISFFWGDATPWIAQAKRNGALIAFSAGSVAEAEPAVAAGVDIIVAQGWEAGGHVRGTVSTMALVPAMVDAVDPVPVLAAGGIGDGRGVAAALCLGAGGAWMGTRFLLASETPLHPYYAGRLLEAPENDTTHTFAFDVGWPNSAVRTLDNGTLRLWEAAGCPPPGQRPGEDEVVAHTVDGNPVVRYAGDFPTMGVSGDPEQMVMYAGQSVGIVRNRMPAADIVRQVADEAAAVLASRSVNAT